MRLQRQTSGLEQSTKVRQLKGNQELNEELQVKADELERLFAAHKLRVSGNQFISSRRTIPVDVQVEEESLAQVPERESEKQAIENKVELNPNMNIVEFGRLNSSKGKLYDRYMEKRDEKLREEWDSRRVQNEEKMKAMNDNLERIKAVLKASSGGSFDQQESRRHAEKLRSFNKQVQDEYVSDSSEQGRSQKDPSFNETFPGDDSTKNKKSKKFTHSRTFSSPTPTSSAPPPIPRSASKGSNVGRRRILPENHVAQSLPNFSEIKEENRRRKETTRLKFSHIPRSKSTIGQAPSTKKESVGRSQSMKKSSTGSIESKDLSPPKSDGDNSTPFQKNGESKPFLKKGNGIGPGAGVGVAKLKAAMENENMNSEDEANKRRDSVSMIKETRIVVIPSDSVSEISRLKQESESFCIRGSDDIVILKSTSQVEPVQDSPPVRPVRDSPVQSPASWSSRMRSPFSYSHKGSDIDVSMESPMASPASWSSRSVTNVETDSPRARKKWGIAHKPFLVANASDHQSSNVAKGFKRLLSFGKKSRRTEGLVDCISSTTSEADDDAEDGHYLADDLRKSRMGFSQGHCSYEAFNDEVGFVSKEAVQAAHSSIPAAPENFKLKDHHLSGSLLAAPKSFFSMPFRSKGSDLKPR